MVASAGNKKGRTTKSTVVWDGVVHITHRTKQGLHYCRLLECDLVGVGKTQDDAFRELREIFSDYLDEYMASGRKLRFHNPSDAQEWEIKDQHEFIVRVSSKERAEDSSTCAVDMYDFRRSLHHANLVAVGS